jgi:hypothetical protein
MNIEHEEQNQQFQKFLNQEKNFVFSAGECNFLIQLLAHLVQENPAMVTGQKGETESLNYQSIRTIVLLNEKLSTQLQKHAQEAGIVIGEMQARTERVQ